MRTRKIRGGPKGLWEGRALSCQRILTLYAVNYKNYEESLGYEFFIGLYFRKSPELEIDKKYDEESGIDAIVKFIKIIGDIFHMYLLFCKLQLNYFYNKITNINAVSNKFTNTNEKFLIFYSSFKYS